MSLGTRAVRSSSALGSRSARSCAEAPISFLHASREPELLYARSPSPKYLGSLASPLGPSASAPAVLGAPGHALPASNTADTIRAFDPPSPGVELASPGTDAIEDVDPQIVEALKSKDRLFVLKLGEIMETIISQHMCVSLPPSYDT
jgi:hypothetical protein